MQGDNRGTDRFFFSFFLCVAGVTHVYLLLQVIIIAIPASLCGRRQAAGLKGDSVTHISIIANNPARDSGGPAKTGAVG